MNPLTLILFLSTSYLPLHASQDILNFKNNDTLHGEFVGFKDTKTLVWKSNQAKETIPFKTNNLRKVVFNQGLSRKPFVHSSLLTLSNGDILPCSISSITKNKLYLHTDFANDIVIEKKMVVNCILNPLGQQILYAGPYSAKNWDILSMPENNASDVAESELPCWEFGSFGWYNRGGLGAVLLRDFQLPDNFRLKFQTESPRHSNSAVIIHADLQQSDPTNENGEPPARLNSAERITSILGSCLAIKLGTHNATLTLYSVLENGESHYNHIKPINGRSSASRQSTDNHTDVELRVNRTKQVIALYYDQYLVNQWSLKQVEHLPTGSNFGFLAHYSGPNYLTRISEISIAPWNGVLDSALSLESPSSDILMLANGKERFAGKVTELTTQQLNFDGTYAEMVIPRNELQSIHFAKNQTSTISDIDENSIVFELGGSGFITAIPESSEGQKIKVTHPILGNISLDTSYLTSINYQPGNNILDQWNSKID
ncbi:hypothetical protein ACFPK9_12820 [Rubritalea spongiae]|uniref:Uncharacterized protein n=1 Tax=Rubritalea spongiae TaxID=430797 RepID=A0ABW5E0G9_9BACT